MKNRLMINMHLVSKANTRPAVSEIGYAIFNEREVVQVGRISIDLTKYRSSQGFEIDGASVANYYSNLVETPEIKGRVSPEDAAETLVALYEVYDCCQVWDERMNSPIENIEPMIRASSASMPWKPHNVMDFRTVQQVMPHILIDVPNAFTIQGQAHWRAQYLIEVFNRTKWFGEIVDDGNTWKLNHKKEEHQQGNKSVDSRFSLHSGAPFGGIEVHGLVVYSQAERGHTSVCGTDSGDVLLSFSKGAEYRNSKTEFLFRSKEDLSAFIESLSQIKESLGLQQGSVIPSKGTWILDPSERVLNPNQNKDLTAYLEKAQKLDR